MHRYVAGLPVDVFEPERHKFRPLLLMIHDLWVGGWCWHDWATRFCNLGWECWAVSLRGRDPAKSIDEGKGQTFDDCVRDLNELYDSIASPMIVVAHGFGAALAYTAFSQPTTAAAILLAPAFEPRVATDASRALRLLQVKYLPLMLLRQPVLIRASDFARLWLNCVEKAYRREVLQGLVPESPRLVRQLFQRTQGTPFPGNHLPVPNLPMLLLGGTDDCLVATDSVQALATDLGREYRRYPQRGHWMLHETGWQEVVNDVHRWIVNTMGESILVSDSD